MTTVLLTAEQQAVVDADLIGPRLVDAGAGTGKTFTLVQRAVALMRRGLLAPQQLLVMTFTKSAASEIAARLEAQLDPADARRPVCGTFHGVAVDLLREFAYEAGISPDVRVIDDGRARGVFARAFGELLAGGIDVDLSAFPLLERPKALERSLAAMVLNLKQRGEDVPLFMERAYAAADELDALAFGAIREVLPTGKIKKDIRPDPERTSEERRLEAERERLNVRVVGAVFARFQQLLDSEHLLTFGDILIRATRMLHEHPAIAATLRRRWKHAIVDEFQDTNPAQIAFLEAMFGDDLAPVLVVGDVRQAIFEFNGAEPQGIIDFRNRARETLPLSVNRRSVQPVLDVAHSSLEFLANMGPQLNARLKAHRGDAPPTCIRLELFEGDDAVEHEAALIADTIRALVDDGVSPQACAVLMRTRMRAGVFARAIRARGLPVQLYGGVGFFDAAEVRDVVAWLRLAHDPADDYAVTAALQSAAVGIGDGGVALLAAGGALARAALADPIPAEFSAAERERVERFRRTARVVGALTDTPLVEAVRSIVAASGAEIARVSDEPSLAQVRANLDKLVRFAADFAGDRPLARIHDLVEELRERDELDLDLPIAEVEGERIAMLTIHAAKGLEWDHVFVADVGASFPLRNNGQLETVAQFDVKSGALALKHAVDGRPTLRWFMAAADYDETGTFRKSDVKPRELEEFRLLYVALTRAKDALYVTGRKTKSNYLSPCFKAVDAWATSVSGSREPHRIRNAARGRGQLEFALSTLARSDIKTRLKARALRSTAAAAELERRGALSYTAMALLERCPRRARYQYVLGLPDLRDDSPAATEFDEPDERSARNPARYGRVIHRALELFARARIGVVEPRSGDLLEEAFLEEEWLPTPAQRAKAEVAVERAAALLGSFELIDAERRFELSVDGVQLGGYIDLIARGVDGTAVIVDYKTGQSAPQQHALQFGLYRYAVRNEFPDARTCVLRITDDAASFEPVEPASESELRAAVAAAHTMQSDEARPGPQCDFCPYAHDVCSAARDSARDARPIETA